MSGSTYEIVIVGGNLGGVAVAHYLLKNTIPALRKQNNSKSFHVTIVSPSSHYFWKIAAPRVLVKGEEALYEQILRPIDKGFAKYGDLFAYIQGAAIATDPAARTIRVKKNDSQEESIHYDSLVIATGTTSATPLWTLHGDHLETLNALKTTREELSQAKTVLVAGGGAVGVESSGEIVTTFPNVKVTILSGTDRLLARSTESLGKAAETSLKKLGVEVIHNVRITGSEKTIDGHPKLKLSDGTERIVDVYIDGTGGAPNTDWLPAEWLNEGKRVQVDDESLRVTGPDASRVYAVGDAASYSKQSWLDTDSAVIPVASSIAVDIATTLNQGKAPSQGMLGSLLGYVPGFGSSLSQKKFSPMKGIFLVPMGPSHGVGMLMGFEIPTFMLSLIKGKSYFLSMSRTQWNGDAR
ncbi:MAG: hypothetical protein GOMPHAMPRED_000384 [Gomphillus americanus]|uniref:FAD/NAD(P)-binding domain-containing protein n=1 Tax=Gomphillus americanus TaxID=1940652 RepID=A0A8H3EAP9_9LECA|nr:MAG: hypothetical protein GOMPHAMPRED_000384 [Gomphillus americanus]